MLSVRRRPTHDECSDDEMGLADVERRMDECGYDLVYHVAGEEDYPSKIIWLRIAC
jgi:hypothetical protein